MKPNLTSITLTHMQTAVNGEIGTSCVSTFIRGDPGNDRSDFFWLCKALNWNATHNFLQDIRTNCFNHVCTNVARGYCINCHTLRCDLLGKLNLETMNTGFCCRVICLTKLAFLAV